MRAMRLRPASLSLVLVASLGCLGLACGGSTPPANQPDPSAKESPSAEPVASASSPSAEAAYDDPEEKDPQTLTPLFDKAHLPTFPTPTAPLQGCWHVPRVGDAHKDFAAVVAACGTPTGAVEYVKPAVGRLHADKDKRDTFNVKVESGMCYRFFGVADGSIKDLDILILREGAYLGEDKVDGPVAVISGEEPLCVDLNGSLQFSVQVDGPGTGRYIFGVWAHPPPKAASSGSKKKGR
jgi:hypothetical protein